MTLTYIAANKPEGLKVKNKIGILDNSALKMHVRPSSSVQSKKKPVYLLNNRKLIKIFNMIK
jgi:hypothetical protein